MAVISFRVSAFARDIYLYGNRTLSSLPEEYIEPVKEYAVNTFTEKQVDDALVNGYITQQEYDETMAYKKPIEE